MPSSPIREINNQFPELCTTALQFRTAIEICDKRILPVTFQTFPRGACGDASLLLAKYLEESGYGSFKYVLGKRNEVSHAWLENDATIVDITADQFTEISEPVIVAVDSKWHSSFDGQPQHIADFEIFDKRTRNKLRSAYNKIIAHIYRLRDFGVGPN